MMKKKAICLIFLVIIGLGIKAQQKESDKFRLTIDVSKISPLPRVVILTYFFSNGAKMVGKADSALVENGKVRFEGVVSGPSLATLQTAYFSKSGMFCLSPDKLTIMAGPSISELKVKGSPYQKDFISLHAQRGYADRYKEYVTTHAKTSALSVYALYNYMQFNKSGADSLYQLLTESFKMLPLAVQIRKTLDQKISIAMGVKAPEFSLPDTSGRQISLKSLKGKYVFVDFLG